MSRSIHLRSGDTIAASRALTYDLRGQSITFLNANQDTITATGRCPSLTLGPYSQNDTIIDHARGMHLTMDSSAFITIKGFQNDPTGHIDLYNSGLSSAAELKAHTFSDGQGGTIVTIQHGLSLTLQGDAALRPGQITWHS
jgi:hypothetical protein